MFRAAEILRAGGTVAFPTETVYGLGADALSPAAVAKIFEAKQRPGWDPLIVHVAHRAMLERVADLTASEDGGVLQDIMDAFWPGPLTILLPRRRAVPDAVTAGRPLVGVRMPSHPVALELIRLAGVPLAAPSANLFGHTSPTTAAHVVDDLDGRIDAVLDGGPATVGVESTVIQVSRRDGVMIYRPGAVTLEILEHAIGGGWVHSYIPAGEQSLEAQPSPGVTLRHYAPRARLVLVEVPFRFAGPQDELIYAVGEALTVQSAVGVMLPDEWTCSQAPLVYPWGPWERHDLLAQRLFSGLRALDDAGAAVIVCPVPNGKGIAAAIRDRLAKAAKAK